MRPVQSSLEFEVGLSGVRNTYLAPLRYNGSALGVHYERFRTMRSGKWHNQQIIDGEFATGDAENGKNSTMLAMRSTYRYAMHRSLFSSHLSSYATTLYVGPYAGVDIGYDYNLKLANSNNPATARFTANLGISAIAKKGYTLRQKPCSASLQVKMPLVGTALATEFGQSYYEAFLIEDDFNGMHFTSLHNQQDLDLRLTTDIPLAVIPWFKKMKTVIRVGGYYHIETMDINDIVTRYSNFGLTIGWTWKYLPL